THPKPGTWTGWPARIDDLAQLVALSWRAELPHTDMWKQRPGKGRTHPKACPGEMRIVDESCGLRMDPDYAFFLTFVNVSCPAADRLGDSTGDRRQSRVPDEHRRWCGD